MPIRKPKTKKQKILESKEKAVEKVSQYRGIEIQGKRGNK